MQKCVRYTREHQKNKQEQCVAHVDYGYLEETKTDCRSVCVLSALCLAIY